MGEEVERGAGKVNTGNAPTRNVNKNPSAINIAVENQTSPRHIVPIQLNILIPVGTAMRRLMMEKNGKRTVPVVKHVVSHTPRESAPMVIVAKIIPLSQRLAFVRRPR